MTRDRDMILATRSIRKTVDNIRGGEGVGIDTGGMQGPSIRLTRNHPRFGKILAEDATIPGNYRIAEIDIDGAVQNRVDDLTGAVFNRTFNAWEADKTTGLAVGTKVIANEMHDGQWVFLRRVKYVVIANQDVDFATLDQANPGTAGWKTVALNLTPPVVTAEKRVLIHCQTPLVGENLETVIADLAGSLINIATSGTVFPVGITPSMYWTNIELWAIGVDFDPETITWNEAYVTVGGTLPGNEFLVGKTVFYQNLMGGADGRSSAPWTNATNSHGGASPMWFRTNEVTPLWGAAPATVYGFELRLVADAGGSWQCPATCQWGAVAGPRVFALRVG